MLELWLKTWKIWRAKPMQSADSSPSEKIEMTLVFSIMSCLVQPQCIEIACSKHNILKAGNFGIFVQAKTKGANSQNTCNFYYIKGTGHLW